jgi:methyl-galactoside transport system substrate-binding protein
MKRTIFAAALLCSSLGLALGLAGCEGPGSLPRIGVALSSIDDSNIVAARRAIESAADGKARLSILDAQGRQTVQNEQITRMFEDKAKAVIVNLADGSILDSMVFQAKSANVPIVFLGKDPSSVSINMWDRAYYVGARIQDAFTQQAEMLAAYWKANPTADSNSDGYLQYIFLRGDDSKTSTGEAERKAVFDAEGVKSVMIVSVPAGFNRVKAHKQMAELLGQRGSHFEAIVCENDEMALGAIEALRVAGYFGAGDKQYVPVIGIDGTGFALAAIADGSLYGTVRADAAGQGSAAFAIANALARGDSAASAGWALEDRKFVIVPYAKVTRDNYKDFM